MGDLTSMIMTTLLSFWIFFHRILLILLVLFLELQLQAWTVVPSILLRFGLTADFDCSRYIFSRAFAALAL